MISRLLESDAVSLAASAQFQYPHKSASYSPSSRTQLTIRHSFHHPPHQSFSMIPVRQRSRSYRHRLYIATLVQMLVFALFMSDLGILFSTDHD
ncbi:hypothetical protein M378DRAFT_157873 [Amanita muscaria Koide BX008]|uniref:Uncharacterized protein n=1 Tax=Amanita muscaria (strain Koide BX008) TaxID=946122 RepID=A0A0C2XH40_AMAMK|nr:hypothetical protein M378DRAFT_157873 [Amanita muscaria Koide BX008]